jgi:internalin A
MANHFLSLNLNGAGGLYLSSTQVSDLTPLAHLTNLQQLHLWNTPITDITPLRHLTQLRIMA